MRILVTGLSKSGTSGLFACVKQSAEVHFGRPFSAAFEPKTDAELDQLPRDHALAKVLSERLLRFSDPKATLAGFDKKLMIVRDPRDNVVSRLLWLTATRIADAPAEAGKAFLSALRRKERDPQAVSVIELYRLAAPITGHGPEFPSGVRTFALKPLTMMRRFPDLFVLRYEDFVDQDLSAASAYLGFPLQEVQVPPDHRRILRAGRYGDWVNWFTDEDIAFYSDAIAEDLAALGYAGAPAKRRRMRIAPDEATGYVARVSQKARPGTRG